MTLIENETEAEIQKQKQKSRNKGSVEKKDTQNWRKP